jgi:hypothetical protein
VSIEDEQANFQREGREGEIFGEYLMRTAARREIEFLTAQLAGERKDNARLRGLVKQAEWEGGADDRECPWCGFTKAAGRHGAECPAFYGPALPWCAGKVR